MNEIEIGGLFVLVAGGFAATNLDNLILLVILMGADVEKRAHVALGFLVSAICILGIAATGAAIGSSLDPNLLGYMGLAPLIMGMYLLYKRLRSNLPKETAEQDAQGALQSGSSWISTFLLMFSNSGDSLAIFFPLLAESDRDSLLWEVTLFLGMALLWLLLAWLLAKQPHIAIRIEHIGEKLVPWIMMAAGIYILLNTGTDTMA